MYKIKFLICCLSFFIFSITTFAQVGEIKTKSNKNTDKPKTQSNNNSSGSNDSGGGCLSDIFNTCFSSCVSSVFEAIVIGSIDLHKEYISQKKEIPTVTSLEFMPTYGYCPKGSHLIMPRIRGNWGLFSTDFRYYNILESTPNNGIENYKTYDWQIIELNPLITKNVKLRIGSGFMYEDFSRIYFNESSIALDLSFKKDTYLSNFEFKIAKDYNHGSTPRTEGNIRFNYKIIDLDNLYGYATLGGLYQNYYSSVDVWTIQAGMAFNFH